MKIVRRLNPILLFLLFAAVIYPWRDCPAQRDKIRQAEREIKTSKSKLEEIEEEIRTKDERAKGLAKQEHGLAVQIQDIERRIDKSRQTLKSLNSEIEEISAEINYINHQLAVLAQKLKGKKAILYRRIREIYKRGRLHEVAVLIGSHSFTDFLKRIKYLTLIAGQDKRLVREVGGLQQTYGEYRRASERKLALRVTRKEELEREQQSLQSSETQHQKLLKSVKTQRAEVLKALEERKADRERMRSIIAELERRRLEAQEKAKREGRVLPPETAYLDGRMGKLKWPVAGGRMIRGFGPYEDSMTRTRVINNGIDIKAELGSEVHSVAGGTVEIADWYRTYGKMVMLYHGSGMYTIYGHLGEVFVQAGDFVAEGQTIASVGATGSLEGPLLYFELRNGGRAEDPLKWLGRM